MARIKRYNPNDFGGEDEKKVVDLFNTQKTDAKYYFENCIKPRLDRSYKLYISDNSDRAREIKGWQANVFVPYTFAVIETLKPRILDARPEFSIQGRTADDQLKAPKVQGLQDYTWEISKADTVMEDLVSASLVYGTGFIQVYWKKDVRTNEFLDTKNFSSKKLKWVKKTKTFYDAPCMEWVDNYELWYDWHNTEESSKQYWFRRKLLTKAEIIRRYPMADEDRLEVALASGTSDLTDYASIRNDVKLNHENITKGKQTYSFGNGREKYGNGDMQMYEVFEWLRPFDDKFAVMVGGVPILKSKTGVIPNPYDFKESIFIGVPYLKIPGEYEGYGIPMILENPQIMLNMIRNQRLDAATLNIHKMWIINPLANINKEELVVRPFGIIYSQDPNGAREVQSSDIKASAYKEDEILKGDMRYSSGVDDFSMGVGGGGSSATEVRHLRESTLERVRLFVNHLGDGLSKVMRYWTSMWGQFGTDQIITRIIGEDGKVEFPLVEQDDIKGEFDYVALVIASIAGGLDVKKKQDMDLFQLLSQTQKMDANGQPQPVVDIEKLIAKLLLDFNWDYDSLKPGEVEPQQQIPAGTPEEMMALQAAAPAEQTFGGKQIPDEVARRALELIGSPTEGGGAFNSANPMGEMANPVNLLTSGGLPPTAGGMNTGKTSNTRGMNRKAGGKVNTNIPVKQNYNPEAQLQNRAANIQR